MKNGLLDLPGKQRRPVSESLSLCWMRYTRARTRQARHALLLMRPAAAAIGVEPRADVFK